ncbi:hypothetical protein SEA_MUFASA8_104 [Arthrobacter phage Mufasa8]|uniref:Uncharacterized protein n=1 Tax=Arthrobacter phage Mufasa8 TaxID=2656526 RepID=A0A649VMU2_9CAUD|nr:hypothetical protein HYQ08_gp104 [Arthrobacter phage Mufasa8]QGJ93551.1 hypothetical protein SEA_MUFASA8_104 [Arthrobacter phage Mufasa8]
MALTIKTQEALTEAGFAPTAGADFAPTGNFVLDYTDKKGAQRRTEVAASEGLNIYQADRHVTVRYFENDTLLDQTTMQITDVLFLQLAAAAASNTGK